MFCFSDLIQQELEVLVEIWNTHHICRFWHDAVLGIPSELDFLLNRFLAENNKQSVPEYEVTEVLNYINQSNVTDNSENVYQTNVAYLSEIWMLNGLQIGVMLSSFVFGCLLPQILLCSVLTGCSK